MIIIIIPCVDICLLPGYVAAIDGYKLAIVSHSLGAGRANMSDLIDHAVGIRLFIKYGSKVNKGNKVLLEFLPINATST